MKRALLTMTLSALLLLALALPGVAAAAPLRVLAAGGFHSLWIADDGLMWGVGYNAAGALGDGTLVNRPAPVAVGFFDDWVACAAGYYTSYGLRADGSLWAWGANDKGQVGTGATATKVTRPKRVGGAATYTSLAAGAFHALAVRSDGTLWSWGRNNHGQLGNGSLTKSGVPVRVGTDSDWIAVAAHGYHSAAKKADGSWWMWGYNGDGQLGLGNTADRMAPVLISGPGVCDEVFPGGYQTFSRWAPGMAKAGQLTSAGRNQWGQLGRGTWDDLNNPVPSFAPLAVSDAFIDVGPGWSHTLGLTTDGRVMAWGRGIQGAIGNGTAIEVNPTPADIGLSGVTALAAGEQFSLARRDDASVWGWGTDASGQLGLSGSGNHLTPTRIAALTTAYLAKPVVPAKLALGRTLTARGIMLPNHLGAVQVGVYRKTTSGWTLVTTKSATVRQTSSGAQWTITYRPAKLGSWYVQASHEGDAHTLSLSPKAVFAVVK
jgi:alpha-tubulin suppressor-like RCC1 family protein